ncbi:hypothetical protein G5I_07961 [Acromyrmex echinatior]|uniref:Uncharacterized protein n=1 Tax=Acromyrmex echinatior TaxID=103372 RepID=F4WQ77_ACREC|nr:hypothetical protein G5I_07961 [Acromyrmex echinatior]
MTLQCCSCCTHKSSPSDTGIQHVRLAQVETGLNTFAKVNAQSASRLLRGPHFGVRRSAFGVARAGARPTDARATTPRVRVHAQKRSERAATKILFPRLPLRELVLYDDGKGIRLQSDITHSIQEKTLCDNCRVIYSRWTATPLRFYEDAGGRAAFAHFTSEVKEFKKSCKEERNFQQNCEGNSQNYVVNEKDFEKLSHCDQIFSCMYANKRIVEMSSAFPKLVTVVSRCDYAKCHSENFRSRGTGFKLNLTELSSTLELP